MTAQAAHVAPSPPRDRLPRRHATRLRHYWRSLGWAHHDGVDIDLLSWGLIEEIAEGDHARRFVLTPTGRAALGDTIRDNRQRRSRHATVVAGVARHLAGAGRLAFTELSVHTQDETRWRPCKPGVSSITRALRADHLRPQVHEVKVNRADLLGELRSGKTARYAELAGSIYFVLDEGIAEIDEIPTQYGVVLWRDADGLSLAREAPRRAVTLQTRHWVALARATPLIADEDSPQQAF